jgi:hypothetical protein
MELDVSSAQDSAEVGEGGLVDVQQNFLRCNEGINRLAVGLKLLDNLFEF